MIKSNVEAIIIRAYPSGESDLVLRLVSKSQGKLSVLAKHARKSKRRFGSRLDVFDRGIFEIKTGRGSLPVLENFSAIPAFRRLRDDLSRLTIASVICESFDLLLLEGAEDSDHTYDLLSSSLEALDTSQTLQESLRLCHGVLGELLSRSGFLDLSTQPQPSAKSLFQLLQHLEHCSEREVQSKQSLMTVVESLRPVS